MAKGFGTTYGPWAIVTGASSGIGDALARELAERGLSLVLVARRRDRLDALARELEAQGVAVLVVELDLGDGDATDRLMAQVGTRDVGLVCANAGFGEKGDFVDLDRDVLRRMIRLNCESTADLVRATVPHLITRGRGGVIIVASLAAFQGTPWSAAYAASKAFDLVLAEGLHGELGPLGVDVVALCPGATDTEGPRRTGVDAARVPFGFARASSVAVAALDGLGRTCVVFPRPVDRLAALATRLVPRALAARLAGRAIQRVLGR